ncbi:hypothetical protein GE115_04765 [Agromyces sp. CFH 90414]|uniref:Uridine kinase n=1 Tax=Agromyces agglutinans TaxID=2662258 RepID=A0A6I2F3M4_9MICO|nr:hypothetical protein [Agromyces agglutinans]MRG59182.1 hypothetical protein [Agromyces agglutinans]
MTTVTEARRELIDGVAAEFLHNSPRARRLVAVGATDAARSTRFADDLAAVLAAQGQRVARRSVGDADEATLRRDTIEPFRAGALDDASDADTVLVVDGTALLHDATRGIWHFSVWVLAGDELPDSGANVIVDATEEDAPTRYFYDYCKLPPSLNRPGLH